MALLWLKNAMWQGRRQSITGLIVGFSILVGAGLAIGARVQLDHLLTVTPGTDIELAVTNVQGDCGTPALYILPSDTGGGTSTYQVLLDFLGGTNRFPMLGGVEATVPVLTLPENRAPGVGLGRGLPQRCEGLTLTLSGLFDFAITPTDLPGVGPIDTHTMSNLADVTIGPGTVQIVYKRPPDEAGTDALVAFRLAGVADLWQYAYKRVGFVNRGGHDVNVFFYEEPGYLFVNSFDNNVRPVSASRSYADAYLSGTPARGENSVVVYRRRPTSEIELQHALISISTLFGIGVSLFIEGVVFALVAFAGRSANPHQNV